MKDHATVGDALIFMTKAAGVLAAILIVAGTVGTVLLWWNNRPSDELVTERARSQEALNHVDLLGRQINALRVQLAAMEQAVDLEQQKVEERQVTIADLGSKLNDCLAGRERTD